MSFFVEDTVALKEDPSILGIVDRTWRDIESIIIDLPKDYIYHAGTSKRQTKNALKEGRCPRGYVFVNFARPHAGCSLVSEAELNLVDRGLSFGDVVKRNLSDAESGTVIRTSIQCDIQPIYPNFLADQWQHAEEDNVLHGVSGSDLTYIEDYQYGDYVIYKDDWVGVVEVAYEQVTVRLENGSVVTVENVDELEQPEVGSTADYQTSLVSALHDRLRRKDSAGADGKMTDIELFYPGQEVTTKKWNLRRGQWVLGAYDPSIPPKGAVLDSRTRLLSVNWLSCNVFCSDRRGGPETPPVELDSGDFGSLRIYDKERLPGNANLPYGSTPGTDIAVGDILRFRDGAGAAVKYAGQDDPASGKRQPLFRRIPRNMTQGYDLNVFNVTRTETVVTVQWQDGSITESVASALVPYLNVDDHEVWPGEIVALKEEQSTTPDSLEPAKKVPDSEEGILRPKEIGVVESADARERLAKVRWFENPQVGVFDDQQSVLLPGSYLGQLSSKITEVSNYDIVTYPALSKRRGDLVMVAPTSRILALHSAVALEIASGGSFVMSAEQLLSPGGFATAVEPSRVQGQEGPDFTDLNPDGTSTLVTDPPGSTPAYGWFGEIVDLGLNGLLTIRLGALDNVMDIRVPVERVLTVVGGDDDSDFENPSSDDEDSGSSEDWTDNESEASEIAVETIEYEGGVRQDADGNDEMWTTDDDEDGGFDGDDTEPSVELSTNSEKIIHSTRSETHAPLTHFTEIVFSTYPSMPPQFDILLDPPPPDHKYLSEQVALSGALMRRVLKEHSILKNSLPNGIWVRTWADRLDLLRVLILGPQGTPYEFAPMIFDMHFSAKFPNAPPEAMFHSWTNGVGRINPNLYEDGKVCLSLLGTWPENAKHEGWSSQGSSLLQILVSIQSLVLVKEPYYNEAGFEALIGTEESRVNSDLYSEKALVMSKGFIAHALSHKIAGVDDILVWLYLSENGGPELLKRVVKDCQKLLPSSKAAEHSVKSSSGVVVGGREDVAQEDRRRLSSGAGVLLGRHLSSLEGRLDRVRENATTCH